SEQNADISELEPELPHRPFDGAHIPLVRAVDENVSIRRGDEKGTERPGAYVINVADHLVRRKRRGLILFRAHVAGQDRPRRIRLPLHRDRRLTRRSRLLGESGLRGGSDKDHCHNRCANAHLDHVLSPLWQRDSGDSAPRRAAKALYVAAFMSSLELATSWRRLAFGLARVISHPIAYCEQERYETEDDHSDDLSCIYLVHDAAKLT